MVNDRRLSAAFVSVSVIVTPPTVAPWRVICFAVEIPLDHEQEPLGMMTVSPSFAEFIALSTSLTLQDAAVKVLACASPPNNVTSTSANKTHFMIFVIAEIPFKRANTVGALTCRYCLETPTESTVRRDRLWTGCYDRTRSARFLSLR